MSEVKLVKYDAARLALQAAHRVDEAKLIKDQAVALQAYARQVNDGDMLRWVSEIKLRAERRMGELLRETAETGQRHTQREGGSTVSRRSDTVPTLKQLGLTRDQSSQAQKLAAIPEQEFERRIEAAGAEASNLTADRILAPIPRVKVQPSFAAERELWAPVSGWLRQARELPPIDELKRMLPTGGSAEAILGHLEVAAPYMAALTQLLMEDKV